MPVARSSTQSRSRPARSAIEVLPEQKPVRLEECRRCGLWHGATQAVPGEGSRHASIMLLGEQPGDREDRSGQPFVGPAGALLDRALQDAGVVRTDVYVTNAVKHFKWQLRGKRRMHKTPAQREVMACRYWLEQELEEIDPAVVVALGATALRAILPRARLKLTDVLGGVIEEGALAVVPTYHPSYALRAPDGDAREQAYLAIVHALRRAGEHLEARRH
ncbi:UdgX family uracil-DNA binding protein [Bordetella sp. 2513F-2]